MEASSPIRDISGNHVITSTSIMKILLPFVLAMLTLPLPAQTWHVRKIADGGVIHRFFDTSPISPSGRYAALFRLPVPDYSLAFQGFCSHPHTWPLYCYYKLYR